MRTRMCGMLAAAVLVLGATAQAAPVPANKTALTQVPATAPVVFHVRGIDGVVDRLIAFLKNALPDQANQAATLLRLGLAGGLDGRQFKGMAKDGPIFAVLTELPKAGQEDVSGVILVAVTNYAEFRDGILKEDERKKLEKDKLGFEVTTLDSGKTLFFVDRKDFAVVTPSKDAAVAFTKPQANGLDKKISPALTGKLLSSDLGVYFNLDIFGKQYAEQVKEAKQTIEDGLKGLGDALPKEQRGGIEVVRQLVGPAFQALEDSQGALLSVEFRPDGVALHIESELRPGSATGKALGTVKPIKFDSLGLLPGGSMFYTGIEFTPDILKLLNGLMLAALESDSKEAKAMKAAIDELAKFPPRTQLDATTLPTAGLRVWTAAEPARSLAAQLQLTEAMGAGSSFATALLKDKPVIKKDARKYRDISWTEVTVQFDLEKMADSFGGGQEIPAETKKQLIEGMKKLMGEKVHTWLGADAKHVYQVTAEDWAAAEKTLDRYFKEDGTLAAQAGYRTARKELPAEANVLALIDVARYASNIVDMMRPVLQNMLPIQPNYPAALPKDRSSYAGLAVVLTGERASLDVVITADTVKDVYKAFVAPFVGN
jgi:hypothetical protein